MKDESAEAPIRRGFIAQEVAELFPEAVSQGSDTLSLSYDIFGVLAIKAIQEQQALIEDKDARIAALEKRLSEQEAAEASREARLTKLERAMQQLVAAKAADAPVKEAATR